MTMWLKRKGGLDDHVVKMKRGLDDHVVKTKRGGKTGVPGEKPLTVSH
jgi:hypothetical protein